MSKIVVDEIHSQTIENSNGNTLFTLTGDNRIVFNGNVSLPVGQLRTWKTSERPSAPSPGEVGFNTSIKQVEVYGNYGWQNVGKREYPISRAGLVVELDANDPLSYPGSGSVWYDLSGKHNHFRVLSTAYNAGGWFDFNGSYGAAKNTRDIHLEGDVTYGLVTRIKNSTAEWRTLTRSYSADHHVIVQSGAWNIGMYDNDGTGFNDSGYDQTSLPGYDDNTFMTMIWRWTDLDNPTYEIIVNGVSRGSITDSDARYNRGFGSIGSYHRGNTDPGFVSQPWGDIKYFAAFGRRISDTEVQSLHTWLAQKI